MASVENASAEIERFFKSVVYVIGGKKISIAGSIFQ